MEDRRGVCLLMGRYFPRLWWPEGLKDPDYWDSVLYSMVLKYRKNKEEKMKNTKTFTTNTAVILTFVNESKDTKNGFQHITEAFGPTGDLLARAVVKYQNRTWEVYAFQTSMQRAVKDLLEMARNGQGLNLIDIMAIERLLMGGEPDPVTNISDTVTRIQEEILR